VIDVFVVVSFFGARTLLGTRQANIKMLELNDDAPFMFRALTLKL